MTKQAINTRTQEEYDALMRYYEEKNVQWTDGLDATEHNKFELLGTHTCICERNGSLKYASIENYSEQKIPIIPYTEFAKANITPDYKALYLEGRGLLERVCAAYVPETNEQDELEHKIKLYLTKHNDLTNHKDGE